MRHWLVVNQHGDLVAWVETEAHAKAIQGAYPDAKLKIKGPFIPEPPQGAVAENARMRAVMAEAVDEIQNRRVEDADPNAAERPRRRGAVGE